MLRADVRQGRYFEYPRYVLCGLVIVAAGCETFSLAFHAAIVEVFSREPSGSKVGDQSLDFIIRSVASCSSRLGFGLSVMAIVL
jgi:hypothetical protein